MADKQKESNQVLLYNKEGVMIRKISVQRGVVLDSDWMKTIDFQAVRFEKANDF